jgi:hypothetical protein
MIKAILTGLGLGGIVLYAWLWLRFYLDSQRADVKALATRGKHWVSWRRAIYTQCFLMVFLSSPHRILKANGHISDQTSFYMMAGVTTAAVINGLYLHHGLDVAHGKPPRHWWTYVLVVLLFTAYGIHEALR